MKINIIHLYSDMMNLYGSYANAAVLRRHLENAGCEVELSTPAIGETPDFFMADFVLIGAGTERSQKAVIPDIMRLRPELASAADRGVPMLFCGNAAELLGQKVITAAGTEYQTLGIGKFKSTETGRRIVGDVFACSPLCKEPVVGFINKCSLLEGIDTPFITEMKLGFGNTAEGSPEGFVYKNVIASELTGPLLVKNPELLSHVIAAIFERRGLQPPEAADAEEAELAAYKVTSQELSKRIK